MPIQQATLLSYLDEVRRLLHDPNDVYFPAVDKTANINTAMQQRDRDTAGNRKTILLTLTPGTDTYAFSGLSDPTVFDVVNIFLIYTGTRVRLNPMALSTLNDRYRRWTPYRGVPEAWARYGVTGLIFGPIPSLAYATEWDCCIYSPKLIALTDADPLPYPYTDPVAYYAAYLCKLNERQYDEAGEFQELYKARMVNVIDARTGIVPVVP